MNLGTKEAEILLESLPHGITVQNLNGSLIYANRKAASLLGYPSVLEFLQTPAHLVAKRFSVRDESGQALPLSDLPGRKALISGVTEEAILRFHTINDANERWSWVSAVPLKEKGILIGVLNTFYDLTDLKQSEQVLKLLNEISNTLSSDLKYEKKMGKLASLVVPRLADWCAIDILEENNKLVRVAISHIDPDKLALAEKIYKKYPPNLSEKNAVARVLETGNTEVYTKIDPQLISKTIKNEEQRSLILMLNLKSVAIVPLKADGKNLGVITFAYAESDRFYNQKNKEILEVLANRVALLLDNSRLYKTAQRVIKEQRLTYKTLKESDNTLKLALEVGKMGIWDWDVSSDVFSWSDGFKPLYGVRHGNIGGNLEKFLAHVYSSDRKRVERGLRKAVRTVGHYEDEFRIVWPDKSIHWMFKKGQAIKDTEEAGVRMIGIGMDITQRKVSELNLKISEKKFRSVFDTSLDSIMILDDDMTIVELNDATIKLLQLPKKNLLKRNLLDLLSNSSRKEFSKRWKLFQKKGAQRGEIEICRSDESILNIEYSATSQFMIGRNLIILRDISSRKDEEKRREHLLGIVSHELRTPLASIRAFTELLKRQVLKKDNATINYYLSKIDSKTDTLADLINDLLDMTRIHEGKLEYFFEQFEFDQLLNEILNDLSLINSSHNIIKKGNIKREVIADRNRIAQVIINVIKNAIKYSPKANKIIVKVEETKNEIILSVTDFGIGISSSDQKKIFDIFYRVNSMTQNKVYGLGVGLFISSQIIKKHGGRMWVESQLGSGSTFYVHIPFIPKKIKLNKGL